MKRAWPIVVLIAGLVSAWLVGGQCAFAAAQTPTAEHVTIVLAPYLQFSDVTPQATPNLWRLAQNGAVGAVNARSRTREEGEPASPIESALVLTSGAWAQPDFSAMAAFNATESVVGTETASAVYERVFGHTMDGAQIGYLGLPATQRLNDSNTSGAVLGTLGQAVRDANGLTAAVVVTFAGIVVMMNQFKVPPIQRDLMKVFQIGAGTAGWLTSVFALAGLFLAVPAAFILKGMGPKKTGMIAVGAAVIGVAIGALTNNFTVLMVSRVIEGVSVGLMGVVGPSVIAMYFDRAKSGLPMGIWNIWYATGSFTAYNVAVPIATKFSGGAMNWHAMWWFGDIMAVIAFLMIAIFVTRPRPQDIVHLDHPHHHHPHQHPPMRVKLTEGFKVKRAWILAIGFCFLMLTSLSFLTWAPTYFREAYGWKPAVAGSMSSLGYVTSIPASIVCGLLLAKFNTLRQRNIMLILCGVVEMAIYPWCFFVPESFMSTYLVLCGLATGFTAGCVWAAIPMTMPKKATIPVGMGLLQTFKSLANLVGTPLMGYIVQVGGTPDKPIFDWSRGCLPIALFALISITCMICYAKMKPETFEEDLCDA